jgi:hypothetical protein
MRTANGTIILLLLLGGMGCLSSVGRSVPQEEAVVYFVSFSDKGYSATTAATIQCVSSKVWKVPSADIMALQREIPGGSALYDPLRISAKIVLPDRAILVDSHGIGFDASGNVWFFDTIKFSEYLTENIHFYSTIRKGVLKCD